MNCQILHLCSKLYNCWYHIPAWVLFRKFVKFLFLAKWWPFKNYEKCFLFHLKCPFHSWGLQIFVFLSSFLPVNHFFRGWSKINLKVCDVINCLNKNLITNFVWYLEKEKSYDIKTLSPDIVLYKGQFY